MFRLRVKNPEKPVAPGLEVGAVVEFEAPAAKEYRDRIVVTVDGQVIDVPLIAYVEQFNYINGIIYFSYYHVYMDLF